MKRNEKILAIIPARKESKRIVEKNIKKFAGRPLIAWTIIAALKSKLINRVIVSTDSKKIAKIALRYKAETPFLRPRKLAKNSIGIEPVLIHALEWLKKYEGYQPNIIALLMPTNPLKLPQHLDRAIKIFKKENVDSIISVSKTIGNCNPSWMLKKTKTGKVTLFNNGSIKKMITRSQLLPTSYSRNDIIYVLKAKNLYESPSNLYGNKIELYIMDEVFNGDINTPEDWYIALDKFKRLRAKFDLK